MVAVGGRREGGREGGGREEGREEEVRRKGGRAIKDIYIHVA